MSLLYLQYVIHILAVFVKKKTVRSYYVVLVLVGMGLGLLLGWVGISFGFVLVVFGIGYGGYGSCPGLSCYGS